MDQRVVCVCGVNTGVLPLFSALYVMSVYSQLQIDCDDQIEEGSSMGN